MCPLWRLKPRAEPRHEGTLVPYKAKPIRPVPPTSEIRTTPCLGIFPIENPSDRSHAERIRGAAQDGDYNNYVRELAYYFVDVSVEGSMQSIHCMEEYARERFEPGTAAALNAQEMINVAAACHRVTLQHSVVTFLERHIGPLPTVRIPEELRNGR